MGSNFPTPSGHDQSGHARDKNPGTYLVICMFIPHLDVGMYGWVIVRE